MTPILWQHLHGAVTHFPVAAGILSILFDFAALILRRPGFKTVAFWLVIVAALGSLVALWPGLEASGMLGKTENYFHGIGTVSDDQGNVSFDPNDKMYLNMLWHRNLAFGIAGLYSLLALWRSIAKDQIKPGPFAGYLLLSLVGSGLIGYVGYLGGKLVLGE